MGNKSEDRKQKTANRGQNTGYRLEKFSFVVFLSVVWLLSSVLYLSAQEKKNTQGPTVITSKTLTVDNRAKTALFEGSVVARKGEMTLFADRMLVHYSEKEGDSSIKKIDADGNVRLLKGERIVTSRHAIYFADPEEHIIFTGEPRASEGENVITGTKMIYFIADDRSIVENSRVLLMD